MILSKIIPSSSHSLYTVRSKVKHRRAPRLFEGCRASNRAIKSKNPPTLLNSTHICPFKKTLFYMYGCFAWLSRAFRDQRKASDPLGLELGIIISYHVGCWKFKLCPLQESKYSKPLSYPSFKISFLQDRLFFSFS